MLRLSFPSLLAQLPTTAGACWPETPQGCHGHVSEGDPEHPFFLPKMPCLSESQFTAGVRKPMSL